MASTDSLVVCAGTERVVVDRQRFCQYETAPSMGGGASETFRKVHVPYRESVIPSLPVASSVVSPSVVVARLCDVRSGVG